MTKPKIAEPQPIKCLISIFILNIIFEKMTIVTMLDPLNIKKEDPEIKFKAIYWRVVEIASAKAGRKKIHILWGVFPA
jgi:hypothetical protein